MEIGKTVPQGPVKTTLLLDGGQIPLFPTIPPSFPPLSFTPRLHPSPPPPLPCESSSYHLAFSVLTSLPSLILGSLLLSLLLSLVPPSTHPSSSSHQPLSASTHHLHRRASILHLCSVYSFSENTSRPEVDPSVLTLENMA